MLILGIDGSPWKTPPSTRELLEQALDAAKKAVPADGTETVLVRLCDYKFSHHSGSLKDGVPKVLEPVIEYMMKAQGIIFATPVHYFGPSGLITSFVHHMNAHEYPNFPFRGKVMGAIAHCHDDGGQMTLNALTGPLLHYGFMIPPDGIFYRNSGLKQCEGDWQNGEHIRLGRHVARVAFTTQHMMWPKDL